MALHGLIQVTGVTVGSWEARRLQRTLDRNGTARYQCTVRYGLAVRDFEVRHRYAAGAVELAAVVLAEGVRSLADAFDGGEIEIPAGPPRVEGPRP